MELASGIHAIGPATGALRLHTGRTGFGAMAGHDLVIEVEQWDATVEVGSDGAVQSVQLDADSSSLQVREAHNGVKALTEKDRKDIRSSIDQKVLRGKPIAFASTAIQPRDGGLTVSGELTMAETTRPTTFDIDASEDGRVTATLPVTQSDWGIKPYKAFMGALKVRDEIEIILEVRLPSA